MKTYGKRLLSLLLCCVLLLGLLPAAVFAEGEPVLTAGTVDRTSDTAATVKFTSNEVGAYYYAVVDADAEAPTIDTTVAGTPCDTTEQTITLTLTAGAKDVYIVVKDDEENVSQPLKITVPAFSVNLFDAFAALTDTTALPASFDYTLGSEPPYSIEDQTIYAKLLKVEITEADVGKTLNISFYEKTGSFPVAIMIFDDISGTEEQVAHGIGEVSYAPTKADTYYIALLGPKGCFGDCRAQLSLTEDPTDLITGFKALTDTTALPASFNYTLGSEDLYSYAEGGSSATFYARLMKVELEANSALNVSFAGAEESVDTSLWLFSESEGVFTRIKYVDNDSLNGSGESTQFVLADAGTYYLALSSYDDDDTGECHAEISLNAAPEVIPMEDGFKALKDTAVLPASFDYTLGSENILYTYTEDDGSGYTYTYTVYARLMKVELEASSVLNVSFAGAEESVDTSLWLFSENEGVFTLIEYIDSDSLNERGESAQFVLADAGTYYLALSGYDDDDTGPCHGEMSVTSYPNVYLGSLDFTVDPVPVPADGDKWSWDPETRTLTLEDGFSILCPDDDAITLPDGSVVVVKGEAAILSEYDEGINAGNLTVRGGAGSRLIIYASGDGIDSEDILIEDCALNIHAGSDGVYASGSITVRRSVLDITSTDEGLDSDYPGKGVTIESSTLRLVSAEEGIETRAGDITITDSDVNIDTTSEEEGIYASGAGNITVTGGRLVIAANKQALEGNKVTLSNVVFDLRTVNSDYSLLDMDSPDGFSLPGVFRLYDLAGNLLYEGEWKDELLIDDTLYVDNTQVFRAVSVQEHSWSEDWTTDDTHHWHECTDPYCMLTENSDKDGYGEHESELRNAKPATATEDGYTGDTVCKVCGKLLAAGQAIPATGEQPADPGQPVDPGQPADPGQPVNPGRPAAPNTPATGDSSHLLLWIVLLLTSCVGIVVTTVSVRKRIVK